LQAAILEVKLSHIDNAIKKRALHAMQYRKLLGDIVSVKLPVIMNGNREINYAFNIQVERRDKLMTYLNEKGIGTSIYYPVPLHLQKCFEYLGYKKGDFPIAEKLCDTVLALPMFPELTEDEISYVCETIKGFYRNV
jgi:dTDP-4-amino-4,6-dideoxygalactose transaminase